jgi:signal transduction histidine kinase
MRRFASDVFSPRDIRFAFQSPAVELDLQMGADLRRQIFLIFKEAVHNVVRHSGATEASIDFKVEHGWLSLRVADNGRGFEGGPVHDGHGLRSMRERAHNAGGEVAIQSGSGGTTVYLRVPVGWRMAQRVRSPHE